MKKLWILLIIALLCLSFGACDLFAKDTPSDEKNDETELPEGAIELTADNFETYFEIKIKTDLSEDYITDDVGIHKLTKAVTYVAIVPKDNYKEVNGQVKFKVNAGLSTSIAGAEYNNYSIAIGEKSLLLDESIVNISYKLTAQSNDTYYVNKKTNNVTVNSVTGYVITGGEASPSEYESLTDSERAGSAAIKAELSAKLKEYEEDFTSARTYTLSHASYYDFKSLYGSGRDVSNLVNYGKNAGTVDRENQTCRKGLYNYYLKDGELWEQIKNASGLVEEQNSGFDYELLLSELTPSFDNLLDPNAIYIRSENGKSFYAYTTLSSMGNSHVKEIFKSRLDNYGITTKWDKFVVKYTYYFDNGEFHFDSTVTYKDDRYHVEYVDNTVCYGYKITDVNTAKVELYTPENSTFVLEDNIDDAKKYLTGLIEINSDTESVNFSVYKASNTDDRNYLPIRITESGLYEFTLKNGGKARIYSEDGTDYTYYYPAGLYFLYYYNVPDGRTDEILNVEVTRLNDYADMENPIPIEGNSFDVYLESKKDKQAFSLTPMESGLYEFSDVDAYVSFISYLTSDLENYVSACSRPYLTMYFEAGKTYVITVTHHPIEDCTFENTFTMTNVGDPMKDSPRITEEWCEVFLGNGNFTSYIDIEALGYYVIETERTGGIEEPYGILEDESGSSSDIRKITLDDGTSAYYLTPGRYYYTYSAMDNCYFKGRIRYVTKVLGVDEERSVELSFDEYTTISAELPTIGSKVAFYFEISEKCNLLCPSSYFTRLYKEDGTYVGHKYTNFTDVFHERENCYQWADLEPGVYYIILENNNYSGEAMINSRELRLQHSDEHIMQYYYMQVYPDVKREDIHIRAYHGGYLGYMAAIIDVSGYTEAEWSETVGGYEFKYTDSNRITVYKNGEVMTLTELYESQYGKLEYLDDMIRYFYEKHVELFPELYQSN